MLTENIHRNSRFASVALKCPEIVSLIFIGGNINWHNLSETYVHIDLLIHSEAQKRIQNSVDQKYAQ